MSDASEPTVPELGAEESLVKTEDGESTPFGTDSADWPLRKKIIFRKGTDYSGLTDISRFTNNIGVKFPWSNGPVMLPDFTKVSSGSILTFDAVYKVNAPGFLYAHRYKNNFLAFNYNVYIDGDDSFSSGPKYMKTLDWFPSEGREYYTRSVSSYISAGNISKFSSGRDNYFEKFTKTYFMLFSSNNNSSASGNNLFPICPGANTHIVVKGTADSDFALAFVPAANYSSGLTKTTRTVGTLAFNEFSVENARYVFRRQ